MPFAATTPPRDVYSMAPHPSTFSSGDYIATSQIAHRLWGPDYLNTVGGNSSRLHRSSGDLTATTTSSAPTHPSAASTAIWGARPHYVEKIQSVKQGPSTSAFRADAGVAASALLRQPHNSSLHDGSNDSSRLGALPLSEVELVRSAAGDYLTQGKEVAFGQERNIFPSFSSRQATFPPPPPPSHPATRHALNVPHPPRRSQTYHDERSFRNTILPTGLFPSPCQYSSLQEWLNVADASLSSSLSPGSHRTPPPEVTFPELELLETWVQDEEVGLDRVVLTGSGEVGAGVGTGDVEMEEEDDDVDAEGSTEDELETMSDLEEVEVHSEQKQEVVSTPEVRIPERPQSVPEARPSEHVDQAAAVTSSGAPEKKARSPPLRSSTADTLASDTVGTSLEIASRRSQSTNALSPAPASVPSSRESSVLSSADGEGETDDEYVESLDEDGSSLAASRSPSPASSVSIPLSGLRPVAPSSTPSREADPEPHTVVTIPSASPTPQPSSPATEPKSSGKRQPRGPYQKSRPSAQPLDGIPDGAARYCEASQLYECTCHSRTYRRKGDLQRHLSEGSLPEVCDGCGRGFPRKDPRIRYGSSQALLFATRFNRRADLLDFVGFDRHWNQSPLCEAIHHVKNIRDPKEAARWKKRWTSPMFRGKAPQMEQLVQEQITLLASGSDLINDGKDLVPRARTRNRITSARRSRQHKASKRAPDSDEETEFDSDEADDDYKEEDSFHPSRLVELASLKDDLVSESRKATLRKKG
ncbi:hypothetical protein FRC04_002176 [Tulasnella sp. 424]|nr:hypothetical protein FRC04_002176 [Tulasnella sp. 424]KAG8967819.1 hypothetical protein FRC05_001915 [Tulasnella sp. 425]